MTRADCKTLRSAANELASWARSIRDSATTGDGVWPADSGAEYRAFTKHMVLASRLRKIASEEQAKLPRKVKREFPEKEA